MKYKVKRQFLLDKMYRCGESIELSEAIAKELTEKELIEEVKEVKKTTRKKSK